MKELLTQLCKRLEADTPVVLATVIHQEGSTPRGAGSKMLVDANGIVRGTIGGGLAEAEALQACAAALQSKETSVIHFTLTGEMAAQSEMICGGILHIAIEPLEPQAETIAFFQALLKHVDDCETIVLTLRQSPTQTTRFLRIDSVWHTQSDEAYLTDDAKDAIVDQLPHGHETAHIFTPDGTAYIVEKYPPLWRMIIAGGGHVSLFTAQVAVLAGFSVTVLDDREEFSQPERFPCASATYTVPDFAECFAQCLPTKHTCIVIVTRGHLHDKTVLAQALATKAGYIGMIGSKRKRLQVYATLLNEGVTQEQLDTVYSPIGMSIKAETPEEIAVSIVAECIAHRREAWNALQHL